MPNDPIKPNTPATSDMLFASIIKLNLNAKKFFSAFMTSKHPNTICWLLEVLYLVVDKFKAEDTALQKKLKAELVITFDGLIKASVSILSDSFGLTYQDDYGISQLTFSPTAYEMLKRYEFTRRKHELKMGH
jgi:hypothetical protein